MDESEPIIKTYIGKRGKMKGLEFKIILDKEGEILYNKHCWWINKTDNNHYYLYRTNNGRNISFHREITGAAEGQEVDHINRNTLDNCKNNLRFVTRSQNNMNQGLHGKNTSGHRGVHFNSYKKRWIARIKINNIRINIGTFLDYNLACNAYEEKAQELFGEYLGEVSNI